MASPQGSQSPVAEFLVGVRAVQLHLPQQHRAHFTGFWNSVRNRIADLGTRLNNQVRQNGDLMTQNSSLQTQVTNLQQAQARARTTSLPPSSAPRPPTSGSDTQNRADARAEIEDVSNQTASTTIESIRSLPVQFVRTRLWNSRNTAAEQSNAKWASLGCWMTGESTNHPYGYTKINLRNTPNPNGSGNIGVQPFRHQLAIVAGGNGQDLLHTVTSGTYQVSHGCHNGRCFNPDHLWVEKSEANQARKSCVGAYIIKTSDGTIYHPCTH